MVSRILPIASGLAALLLLLPCCSVKEAREDCPVYVTVLTERFIQNGQSGGIVSFHAAGPIDREEINFLSYIGKGFRQPCPRDYARTAVVSGLEHDFLSDPIRLIREGNILFYPQGNETPSVNRSMIYQK